MQERHCLWCWLYYEMWRHTAQSFRRFGYTFFTPYLETTAPFETLLNLWNITSRVIINVLHDIPGNSTDWLLQFLLRKFNKACKRSPPPLSQVFAYPQLQLSVPAWQAVGEAHKQSIWTARQQQQAYSQMFTPFLLLPTFALFSLQMRSGSPSRLYLQNELGAHGTVRYRYDPWVNILFPSETGHQVFKLEASLFQCLALC